MLVQPDVHEPLRRWWYSNASNQSDSSLETSSKTTVSLKSVSLMHITMNNVLLYHSDLFLCLFSVYTYIFFLSFCIHFKITQYTNLIIIIQTQRKVYLIFCVFVYIHLTLCIRTWKKKLFQWVVFSLNNSTKSLKTIFY